MLKSYKEGGLRLLADYRGKKRKYDQLEIHHLIPRSCVGVKLVVAGNGIVPDDSDVGCRQNRVPMIGAQHALAHWMCSQTLRVCGMYQLARTHWHTAKSIFCRTECLREEDLLEFAVLSVVGGCLVEGLCGMPMVRTQGRSRK